jgi:hypothetical protein
MPPARPLAAVYRRFADDAPSPLYRRIAVALSESDDALRAVEAAPARKRRPDLVLAALHELALAGRVPALTSADAALDVLVRETGAVVATVTRRRTRTVEADRCAVLYPLIAEAARRGSAAAVGLVDVGGSAGLNLHVDRVGIAYGDGRLLGDPSSPVQLSPRVVGDRPIPGRAIPDVVARISVGPDPIDVTDADDVRWLRACVPPDRLERRARLDAEIAVAASAPPLLLPPDALAEAVARVPPDALPVVITTWALSRLRVAARRQFVRRLQDVGRPVAWVSVEGVGVAPAVPTFGDRPASGHSILGVAVSDGSTLAADGVGRCWSRGRVLAWLADSSAEF